MQDIKAQSKRSAKFIPGSLVPEKKEFQTLDSKAWNAKWYSRVRERTGEMRKKKKEVEGPRVCCWTSVTHETAREQKPDTRVTLNRAIDEKRTTRLDAMDFLMTDKISQRVTDHSDPGRLLLPLDHRAQCEIRRLDNLVRVNFLASSDNNSIPLRILMIPLLFARKESETFATSFWQIIPLPEKSYPRLFTVCGRKLENYRRNIHRTNSSVQEENSQADLRQASSMRTVCVHQLRTRSSKIPYHGPFK